jgi:HEAT repeat protein
MGTSKEPSNAPSPSVQCYTRLLEDPYPIVQVHAARALGQLGSLAKTALPALRRLLRSGNCDVREAARDALSRIETDINPGRP